MVLLETKKCLFLGKEWKTDNLLLDFLSSHIASSSSKLLGRETHGKTSSSRNFRIPLVFSSSISSLSGSTVVSPHLLNLSVIFNGRSASLHLIVNEKNVFAKNNEESLNTIWRDQQPQAQQQIQKQKLQLQSPPQQQLKPENLSQQQVKLQNIPKISHLQQIKQYYMIENHSSPSSTSFRHSYSYSSTFASSSLSSCSNKKNPAPYDNDNDNDPEHYHHHRPILLQCLSSKTSSSKRAYLNDLIKPNEHFKIAPLSRNIFICALSPAIPIAQSYMNCMKEEMERYDRMDECEIIGIEFDEEEDPPIKYPNFWVELQGYPLKVISGLFRSLSITSLTRGLEQIVLFFTFEKSLRVVDRLTKNISKSAVRKITFHFPSTSQGRFHASLKLFKTSLFARCLPNISILTYEICYTTTMSLLRLLKARSIGSDMNTNINDFNDRNSKNNNNNNDNIESESGSGSGSESGPESKPESKPDCYTWDNFVHEFRTKIIYTMKSTIITYLSECALASIGTFVYAGLGTDVGVTLGGFAPLVFSSLSLL